MEGGDTQTIIGQPQEFTGGVWTTRRTLTGIRAGGFSINAVVDPAMLSANNSNLWKACAGAPGAENISKAPEPENLGPENARAHAETPGWYSLGLSYEARVAKREYWNFWLAM